MSLDFAWFLPTNGDGPHLANSGLPRPPTYLRDFRPPTPDYLRRVAREAEAAGFDSLLVPTATGFEDPWLVAAQLTRATQRIAFIVTLRPGLEAPERIAAQAATLQRLGGGRLRLFAANGSSAYEQRALGDFLDHDARYQRSAECLRVLRRMWLGAGHSVAGSHYALSPAQAGEPLAAPPALYLGGASGAAELVAAGQADTYLLWGEPPATVRARIARLRALAAMHGRRMRFGLRVHVIARDSESAAWARADELLEGVSDGVYMKAQRALDAYDSVAQRSQTALSRRGPRSLRELEVYPNLWAGVGLTRGGAGTAIVGSHDQVAQRLDEYRALGIDGFLLSSYPNLEEAARVGEHVLPRVRRLASGRGAAAH
ncbi:MAG: LLM class flavin-dependent oxidoreductase [Burkholderia gladioli]